MKTLKEILLTKRGIMTMTIELNTNKKYSLIRGISGAHFKQDGEYFGPLGNHLILSEDGLSAEPAVALESTEAPSVNEDLVEYDMDTIASMEDFELFAEALSKADTKPAKTALKSFALDTVGMEKLSKNKGLAKMLDEVRAEYKAVLEADIA